MRIQDNRARNRSIHLSRTTGRYGVLLLTCIGSLLLLLLAGCKSGGSVVTTPTATATHAATATPAPSAQMVLGHGMNKDANEDLTIVGQTTTFNSGDQFTYIVTVRPPFGVGSLTMRLLALNTTPATNLGTWTANITDPTWTQYSQSWTNVDKLMQPCTGSGPNFELDMLRGEAVIASATFTYTGCGLVTTG